MSTIVPKNYSPTLVSERKDLALNAQKNMQLVKKVSGGGSGDNVLDVADRLADKAFKNVAIELLLLTGAASVVILIIYVLFKPLITTLFSTILDTVNGITTITAETLGTITETLGTVIETATGIVEDIVSTTANSITTISGTITDTLATGINIIAGPPTKAGTYVQSGTTITVTITGHGFSNGDKLLAQFITGSIGITGENPYTVGNATDDTFVIDVSDSGTAQGRISVRRADIVGIVPVIADSVKQISWMISGNPTAQAGSDERKGIIKLMADGVIGIVDTITDPTTGLVPKILSAVDDAINAFKNIMTEAQNAFINVINSIKSAIENIVSGIQDGIRFLVEPFLNTSYGIPAIARNLYEVVSSFSSAIDSVGRDIKSGITDVKDAILGLADSLGI